MSECRCKKPPEFAFFRGKTNVLYRVRITSPGTAEAFNNGSWAISDCPPGEVWGMKRVPALEAFAETAVANFQSCKP